MTLHRTCTILALVSIAACGGGGQGSDGQNNGGGNGADGGDASLDGAGGGNNNGNGNGNTCEEINVAASRGIPNVLIVLDKSGSMNDGNRWTQAVPAVNNVVANLESNIAFGLMLFGYAQTCGTGQVVVQPVLGAASDIDDALDATGPLGGTPTAASLDRARVELAKLSGASYVLLVTDGAPNCNGSLNRNSCQCTCSTSQCKCTGTGGAATNCLDDTRTVQSVADLATAGIPTYVIGFDTDAWGDVLDAMASAGGTGSSAYIPVTDGTQLESKLSELAGNVVSCSYNLEMTPSDYRYVRVTLDGMDVKHVSQTGGTSGWVLTGNTVELKGSTCDYVKSTEGAKLSIKVACEQLLL
ncbi:MAG: VWA domain-containing protein [Myxococcales bacterium]|nr:VWA domain-containing protein [Myxococcales bacterium]